MKNCSALYTMCVYGRRLTLRHNYCSGGSGNVLGLLRISIDQCDDFCVKVEEVESLIYIILGA